ncbi:MAG TPA: methyltransferase type 12 [Lentisphaeria bacterium]|nr:methyltransferase type 12 [Lentisphaeria bacterium]
MRDKLIIPENWTFKSKNVAENFNVHVNEQLPWYNLCTKVVAHVSRHFIPENGLVYDIGASTGNVGNAIKDILEQRKATFIPIDNSKEMSAQYAGPGKLIVADAQRYPYKKYDLAICFLALMFIPPAERQTLIATLRKNIKPGGALLIFDKTVPKDGYAGIILSRLALAGKLQAGVSPDEIIAKELSLAGVQRPLYPYELGNATEIFRFGDFAGWIIEAN